MMKILPLLLLLLISFAGCKKKADDLNDTFTSGEGGCGNFRLFKFNSGESIGIGLSGNRDLLALGSSSQTFDLKTVTRDEMWLVVREFHNSPGDFDCFALNDLDINTALQWEAVSGTASMNIIQDSITIVNGLPTYRVACTLNDVTFRLEGNNEEITLDQLIWADILVGGN